MHRDDVKCAGMGWYKWGGPEAQLTEDPATYLTEDKDGMLTSGKEYGYVICHTGYADAILFELSSFNLCRVKDLEGMCSDNLKKWIADNNIEVISFNDIR